MNQSTFDRRALLAGLGALGLGAALPPAASAQKGTEAREFESWLQDLRAEARAQGISAKTLDGALSGIAPIPRVIELDRKQPETTLTFAQYRNRVASQQRIAQGRRNFEEHRTLLNEVAAAFGVQPQYIVALWGVETSYGAITGGFDVVPALATLAFDPRRSRFFRRELLDALKILDQGHISADKMKGSWAGAMGQCQFLPSSFLRFAVDYDGDGRRDIWNTQADVFASAANYLSKSGWNAGERWGRPVSLPPQFDRALIGLETTEPLRAWAALGVTRPDGSPLPVVDGFPASIVQPDGPGTAAFIVYENFKTILKWNRSTYFATTVGLIADQVAAA